MNKLAPCVALLAGAFVSTLSAQTVLSNFTGPDPDGWDPHVENYTVFPYGATAVSGVTWSAEDVLNLQDGGYGGGAARTYSGLPTTGFVTFTVLGRIDTDPGNLSPDPNSNPGVFGSSFGLAAGGTGIPEQGFGYSRSLSTPGDDSGQSFALYAATVRADGSGDFTAFFTPDQHDSAVGLGTWVVQFDDVSHYDRPMTETLLSDFAAGSDGWASTSASNSPFGAAYTTAAQAGGELVLTDGGYTGGAYATYAGAADGPGVHVVLVDVRIVTDNLSIDRARVAAAVGGATMNYSDLSFSQSFSTTGDDSGQSYQTVAVPVITTGPSDVTVYVLPDYDAAIGAGAWEIRIDNVRIASPDQASIVFSAACAAGHHSQSGPVLGFNGEPAFGTNFDIVGSNLAGTGLAGLMVGTEIAPVPLDPYGSFPGSQACVQSFASIPAGLGATSTVTVAIPADTSFLGVWFDVQWFDYDPSMAYPIPFGNSRTAHFTIGW